MKVNKEISDLLLPAYSPCCGFNHNCRTMRWSPEMGHVPRGFTGACASYKDVRLILVCAEPGDPHSNERHNTSNEPIDIMESAYNYAYKCFEYGKDLFHRNVRSIMKSCWPADSFRIHMEKVWITESVLCSALKESGSVPTSICRYCADKYIKKQIELFKHAKVVALGSKAKNRLEKAEIRNFLPAFAAAPPGCNKKEAIRSWNEISVYLERI